MPLNPIQTWKCDEPLHESRIYAILMTLGTFVKTCCQYRASQYRVSVVFL